MSQIPEEVRDIFDAGGRGLQHTGLRKANERAVLTLVAFNPGVSNAEISRLSGLAPQTVSAILVDVERAGLITRGQVLRGRRGQPATPIFLKADGRFAIGCEIGWRHMEAVLINMHGQVLARRHVDYAWPDARAIVGHIGAAARALRKTLSAEEGKRLAGLGVAMPTHIWRYVHQVGADPEQTGLWRELELAPALSTETGLEVNIYNDGNAACWAELVAIPRPRPADVIYFLVSHFIAAGVVGQGTLWEGPSGNSANLGFMLVDGAEDGPMPAHRVASISALLERLQAAGQPLPQGPYEQWDWAGLEPMLGEWIEAGAAALAHVIFNTAVVIETQVAIIDGAMPRSIVERLSERVVHHLAALPVASGAPPRVVNGRLGGLAPAIGAAELPLYRRYLSRTLADLVS